MARSQPQIHHRAADRASRAPAAATYAIGLFKDTSVAYTIGVAEIMFYANRESQLTSKVLRPFCTRP